MCILVLDKPKLSGEGKERESRVADRLYELASRKDALTQSTVVNFAWCEHIHTSIQQRPWENVKIAFSTLDTTELFFGDRSWDKTVWLTEFIKSK